MRCTMCKARQTIVLTAPEAFIRVDPWAGAWSQARWVSIRSECDAWENCPCRSIFGTLRDRCLGARRSDGRPASERYVLLGGRYDGSCAARHHPDYRGRV